MRSTGNDIIDLNKIDVKRTGEYRFYSKILHIDEQSTYKTLPFEYLSFVNYVWLLWSVKESAYKFLKRLEPGLIFSPSKIVVSEIKQKTGVFHSNLPFETSYLQGRVLIKHLNLFFESIISEQYISSAVHIDEDFDNIYRDVKFITNNDHASQSSAAKQFALTKLNTVLQGKLSIDKSETGYPVICQDELYIELPLSLAHHGNYVAYSFITEPKLLPA